MNELNDGMPTRRRPPWGWIVLVLLVGVAVLAFLKRSSSSGPDVELLEATLERGTITATVAATGALESITTVTVGSQVSGPVREVLVDFNSAVHVGQALAVLDPSEFEARLREAEAGWQVSLAALESANAKLANSRAAVSQSEVQVETARAAMQQAVSSVDNQRANVASSEASVHRARAEMDNALLEYKRFEQLFSGQLVAASERDQRRMQYRMTSASYESATANLDAARAQLRQVQAQLAQARNNVVAAEAKLRADKTNVQAAMAEISSAQARSRQSQAQVERARVDLSRTVIRSPVDGTVIDRKIEPGQTVAATFQAPELFKIAKDLRQMQVKADVSEADIGRVALGQKVVFGVDAYPDEKFEGRVTQVRSAPVTQSGNTQNNNVVVYGVLISAPNEKLKLKPGMTATISIYAEQLKDVVLVPDEALRFLPPNPPDPEEEKKSRERTEAKSGDKNKKKKDKELKGRPGVVWVPGPKGPERRDILIGVTDGHFSELVDGPLKEGDKVYTKILDEDKLKRKRVRIAF